MTPPDPQRPLYVVRGPGAWTLRTWAEHGVVLGFIVAMLFLVHGIDPLGMALVPVLVTATLVWFAACRSVKLFADRIEMFACEKLPSRIVIPLDSLRLATLRGTTMRFYVDVPGGEPLAYRVSIARVAGEDFFDRLEEMARADPELGLRFEEDGSARVAIRRDG